MEFSVHELAALLGAEVVGTASQRISGLSKIEEGRPGTISFLANPKYLPHLYTTQATAVLVHTDFMPEKPVSAVLLKVKDPYTAFTLLLEKAQAMLQDKRGIENPCHTAPDAEIGEGVYIGAFSYIGKKARIGKGAKIYPFAYVGDHAVIGEGSVLHPNSTVYYGCRVGSHCVLHAGAVIGSDGFGFAPQPDGSMKKIPQTGIVVLEDHVEIGANTTIDRATLGETIIRAGVKLDNLVQVAHNVEIGPSTVIAAQAGISGSTKLGAHCMVGGQVGIVGHIRLADGTQIGAQSGVSKTVEKPRSALRGSPAQEYRRQLRSEVLFQQLEEMEKRIRSLEAQLKDKK